MRKILNYSLTVLLMLVGTMAFAQTKASGVVYDNLGEPMIGAGVVEVGTSNGTVTDMDGRYELTVQNGAQLEISCIGFASQIIPASTGASTTLEVDTALLDEVVVIGYGTMRRKDVTSSITTVQSDDLNVGVYTTPAQLLQGKVPGLVISNTSDPNGSASISLRGASSLREGSAMEPYYVIDGIPGASINLVSPNDIESIDVLRDASATAIYGSKAANGVIIVTTKKGNKSGESRITYNGYVAWDKAVNTLDMMTADELLNYANANGVNLSPYYDAANPANTNWQDEVLRTGFTHNHNVSINGGSSKTSYSASINYMDQDGVVLGTARDGLTGRAYVKTSGLKDHLDLAFGLNASVINRNYGPTGSIGQSVLDAMYYYSPLVPVYNEDGSYYGNTSISQNYNPVRMAKEDRYETIEKRLQGTAVATFHIIEGLDWTTNLAYENGQNVYNNYNSSLSEIQGAMNGLASRTTYYDTRKQIESYINYGFATADDVHRVNLMAGYSWEQADTNNGFGLSVYNFYDDTLGYENMSYANNMDITGIIGSAVSTLRMISFYGRANYSYMGKYLLQATIRRDGSSAFGKNNRWGTFPSVSAAWRIIDEPFMQDQNIFSDLKFRIGYGVSGNSLGFDAYTALATYGWDGGWFTYTGEDGVERRYKTLAATKNANPDLKWERTSMFNVGIDYGFLGGRLSGTLEYYNKYTSDLIYGYAVSTNRYPYGWMTANVGSIRNKGIEFTLNAVPVQTSDFVWSTQLNLSHNKNVVEKLSNDTFSVDYIDEANPDVGGYSVNADVQRIMEGSPIGQFYLWEWAGYDKEGKSLFNDYDEDGNLIGTTDAPDATDRRAHGSAQPKLTLGWSNDLSYKNWTLSAFFRGVFGNKIYNATRNYYNNMALVANGKNVLAEVADIQKVTDTRAQAPSDRYLENGSYFKLSSLSLAYNFGNVGDWFHNIRVYGTCNNVFTITKYKGIDPEINLGGLAPGVDWRNTQYPRTRSFILGVELVF